AAGRAVPTHSRRRRPPGRRSRSRPGAPRSRGGALPGDGPAALAGAGDRGDLAAVSPTLSPFYGHAGVNIGTGGPPSVGAKTPRTGWPIRIASKSQSTILVIIVTPSSRVT